MNSRKKAVWMIAVSVAILVALVVAKLRHSVPPTCNPNIDAKTVILIDHSEAVSTQTSEAIIHRAWEFIDQRVADGERVSVFLLSALSKRDLRPVFSSCKPRQDGNRTVEDIKQLKIRFQKEFRIPLQKELSRVITGSDESPIAEGLIDLSLDTHHFVSGQTKLLIFSDFLQNSKALSHYTCVDGSHAVRDFRIARIGSQERPQFNNVEVHMHLIPRSVASRAVLQCRDHFWMWFFGDLTCASKACLVPLYLPGNQ